MKSTHEMFFDAGLFDEKDVETRVRLAMYYLQTERFDRTLSDSRSADDNALYQTREQSDVGGRYARDLWRNLKLNEATTRDKRTAADLNFVGLTHFLMAYRDIVEQIENEYEL